jgi:murein DD-endopeptidase MepM/ murein hydrolase activator NlpD
VDIAAEEGEPICAVYGGTVTESGTNAMKGLYLRIQHPNGLESLYCHCSALLVEEGETVAAGDVIAKVGSTGNATGPHLHLELFREGSRIDPAEVLG